MQYSTNFVFSNFDGSRTRMALKACSIFSSRSFCCSEIFSAKTRLASKTVGSFNIDKACKGVFVLVRFPSH